MFRESRLGLLMKLDPKLAADQISAAFAQYNASADKDPGRTMELVGAALDIGSTSLKRYLHELEAKGIRVNRDGKPKRAPATSKKKAGKKRVSKKRTAA